MTRVSCRLALLLAAAGLCLAVSACTQTGDLLLFGYTTESPFPVEYRTVKVPLFVNKTFVRGIETPITEAVVREIEKRTRFKVVQRGDADTELVGVIVGTAKHVPLQGPLNEVREGELVLAVELLWKDLRTGEYLSNPGRRAADDQPPPLAPRDPLDAPAEPPVPVRVVKTATYVMELGQSPASARQKIAEDLARQIVNMMEAGW